MMVDPLSMVPLDLKIAMYRALGDPADTGMSQNERRAAQDAYNAACREAREVAAILNADR